MRQLLLISILFGLIGCQANLAAKDERMVSSGHIDEPVPQQTAIQKSIPPVVSQVPIVAVPKPAKKLQTFTVVATDLPANELLFALARDARLNLDIDPAIEGNVSINAIDQTLPQILKRISKQVNLHYYVDGPNLVIERDLPFTRVYQIDYLNMSRETKSSIQLSTQISSTGSTEGSGGGNNSSSTIENKSDNTFWKSLEENIEGFIGISDVGGAVIVNKESGTVSVNATAAVHEDIQNFLNNLLGSVRKQVLIEATVVEVTLDDDFQAGVDWGSIALGSKGWTLQQSVLAGALGTAPFVQATYSDTSNADRSINASIKALDSFGDVSVMSSPKIMALNNQTSILKVVDNRVYFEIEATLNTSDSGAISRSYSTTVKTVPIGFVMNVTPYITSNDEVILNVRPTISKILQFVNDPNPDLASAGVTSQIPEIQVREMESVLRVANGDTAVIGGLMQDSVSDSSSGLPGLHNDDSAFSWLFGTKEIQRDKTELVIFLRPRIINNANIDSDLQDFKRFLKPKMLTE